MTMRISVKVKTGAREEKIEVIDSKTFLVRVKAEPIDNKANEALIKLLARHFGVAPSTVEIVRGCLSRRKIVDIQNGRDFT